MCPADTSFDRGARREAFGAAKGVEALDVPARGEGLARNASPEAFAQGLGMGDGVSGYILHTVPAVLFCWLRSPGDLRGVVEAVIRLGGDADSTGAIAGGLAGASAGANAIPPEWLAGLCDAPRSAAWMRRLGERLARTFPERGGGERVGPLPLFWPALPLRNAVFLVTVRMERRPRRRALARLTHGGG